MLLTMAERVSEGFCGRQDARFLDSDGQICEQQLVSVEVLD